MLPPFARAVPRLARTLFERAALPGMPAAAYSLLEVEHHVLGRDWPIQRSDPEGNAGSDPRDG